MPNLEGVISHPFSFYKIMKNKIGIIGYGRFGQYLTNQLEVPTDNLIIDAHPLNERTYQRYFERVKIVFICVPIRNFEDVCKKIKPFVREDTILIDVLSVKCFPKDVAKMYELEKNFIHTHPMFGPQSAPNGTVGHPIVICSKLPEIVEDLFFNTMGMIRIDSSVEEHDEAVAETQVINHVVGRAAKQMGIERTKFATLTHEKFMQIVDVVNGNSEELFYDMIKYNPFAKDSITKFVLKMIEVSRIAK